MGANKSKIQPQILLNKHNFSTKKSHQ